MLARVLIVLTVLGLVGMWIYAFSPWSKDEQPDQLDDIAYAQDAEAICAPVAATVDEIRESSLSKDLDDRADKVEEANRELETMIRQLRGLEPASAGDRRIVQQWLADWDTLIADREHWVELARTKGEERLWVTDRGGMSITETMDAMAKANDMESCATPIGI